MRSLIYSITASVAVLACYVWLLSSIWTASDIALVYAVPALLVGICLFAVRLVRRLLRQSWGGWQLLWRWILVAVFLQILPLTGVLYAVSAKRFSKADVLEDIDLFVSTLE